MNFLLKQDKSVPSSLGTRRIMKYSPYRISVIRCSFLLQVDSILIELRWKMNFLFRREMVVGEPIRITIPSSQAKNGGAQGSHPTLQRAQTIGQQQFPKSSNPSNEKPDSQTTHQKILSRFANGQGPKGPIVPGSAGQASGHTRQKSDSSQNGQPGFNVSIVGPTGSNQPVNKSTNQNTGNIIILLIAFFYF